MSTNTILPEGFRIVPINEGRYQEAIELAQSILNIDERYGSKNSFSIKLRIRMSPKYSVVLLHHDKIIGGYFFSESNNLFHEFGISREKMPWIEKNIHLVNKTKRNLVRTLIRVLKQYKGKGIEGVALFLQSKYRNKGLGKALISYPYTHLSDKFSYIWGGQEKSLNNIMDWLKRREVFYDTGTTFYTIASLRNDDL